MDWKSEAIKQAAAAGELRIVLAAEIDAIRVEESSLHQMLLLEENNLDRVMLQWKLDQKRTARKRLEGILNGNAEKINKGAVEGKSVPD